MLKHVILFEYQRKIRYTPVKDYYYLNYSSSYEYNKKISIDFGLIM